MRRGPKIHRCLAIAIMFFISAALITGMTGCTGDLGQPGWYELTISSAVGGTVVAPGEATFTYDAGRSVSLVASPDTGYRFDRWTGDTTAIANANAASTTITMNGDYSITASFVDAEEYTLTIASTAGGEVAEPGEGAFTHYEGTVVDLVATPDPGYRFDRWTGDTGTIAHVNAESTIITVNGDYSITANFVGIEEYTLTIASTAGGEVTEPGEGASIRYEGTVVNLVATPDTGYVFVNWTGDIDTIDDVSAASTTITMDDDYFITANFDERPPDQYQLVISSTTGGSVATPGEGAFTYEEGTVVDLVATPAAGYVFVNWAGDTGAIADVNAASTTITMNDDYSITATFETEPPVKYNLTVSSGTGGSVTVTVNTQQTIVGRGETRTISDITGGTTADLFAEPASGYAFSNWTGDTGTIGNVDATSTTITGNGHYSITANFGDGPGVKFPDPKLEAALRKALGEPTGPIYASDLAVLTSFSSTHQAIADLSGLEHCINLMSLNLRNNQISNMAPLAGLTNLTQLNLSYNNVHDLSPLAGLTKLVQLDLSYNKIQDISPLAGLTGLLHLYMHGNQISNLSPLASLTGLNWLYMNSNDVADVSPLAGLINLTRLLLSDNQISDTSPLTSLTKLTWLYLRNNSISDISPLATLTGLTQLELSHNQVSQLLPLTSLTKLGWLYLSGNQIVDISSLAGLMELTRLDLRNNQVEDIAPLADNAGLGEGDRVYLQGNPLSADSLSVHIPVLELRGVTVFH